MFIFQIVNIFITKSIGDRLASYILHFRNPLSLRPDIKQYFARKLLDFKWIFEPATKNWFLALKDAFPKAKAAAARALELDSTLADAHASIGFFKFYFEWNWTEAEKEFKTAIALNPNYALGYDCYGYYLTMMGEFDLHGAGPQGWFINITSIQDYL